MSPAQLARAFAPGGVIAVVVDNAVLAIQRDVTVTGAMLIKSKWPRETGESRENVVAWAGTASRRLVFIKKAKRGEHDTPKTATEQDRRVFEGQVAGLTPGQTSGVSHSGPEARVLEFGRYPGVGPRTQLGESGPNSGDPPVYSKQAPNGMFRVTAAELAKLFSSRRKVYDLGLGRFQ